MSEVADRTKPRPAEVWDALLAGNRRFTAGQGEQRDFGDAGELAAEQHPVAAVLACSDSRVPVEVALDQGPGQVFTVRTAGHALSEVVLGSLEYAVTALQVPLLVVLGHQRCGALEAALALAKGQEAPGNIAHVARCVLDSLSFEPPAWAAVPDGELSAGHAHVRGTLFRILEESPALRAQVESGALAIVGAHYSLQSGRVHEVPASRHGF